MANTKAYVSAGKGGKAYIADLGTTLPTDATTALAAGFADLGYVSEDGVVNANTPESEEIKAWGGDVVLLPLTSKTDTFQATFIESLNVDVLKMVYGEDNVSGDLTNGISIEATTDDLEAKSFVFEVIMTGGVAKRIVIPQGKITEIGEITYIDNNAVGYPVTITAMATSGTTHNEYLK